MAEPDAICTNPECSQLNVPKTNPGFDLAEVRCGACGQPVTATTTEDQPS